MTPREGFRTDRHSDSGLELAYLPVLTRIDRKRGVPPGLHGLEVGEGGVWLLAEDGGCYVGARFFKCDLHMHTPGDAQNWRDPHTRITREASDAHKAEVARAYLARCHEVGLEVIAVTDHNFARTPDEAFVNWLRKANDSVASELGRAPLVIFPGFEIQANVGRGCHVLCVFPEGTDLYVIDGRLTNCGLSPDSRFDENGRPRRWKIEHYHHWMASSMAEEMLLWRMLTVAEAFGAEQRIQFDEVDFADLMLEDTDFLLLFDRSLDGIEYQTDTTLKHLGIASLHPENWFDPYEDSRLWWDESD